MIARHLSSTLRAAARQAPVVTLTGPRQSGKTTLARAAFPRHDYATLEDPDVRAFALEDPRGFLDQYRGGVVIDEAQRAPDLFSYVQSFVDRHDEPGRFVLSGSQNFLLSRSVSQTLAGRCAILHLLPFSFTELASLPALDVSGLGRRLPRNPRPAGTELMATLFRGFYPRIHDKRLDPRRWLRDYQQTYVERDVRELVNVGDLETFRIFVRLCAGRNYGGDRSYRREGFAVYRWSDL